VHLDNRITRIHTGGRAYGLEIRERVIACHRENVSCREIARRLQVDRKTVAKYIDRSDAGFAVPLPMLRGGGESKLTQLQKIQLVQAASTLQGMSIPAMATYIHELDSTFPHTLHPSTYSKVLRQLGMVRRSARLTDPAKHRSNAHRDELRDF